MVWFKRDIIFELSLISILYAQVFFRKWKFRHRWHILMTIFLINSAATFSWIYILVILEKKFCVVCLGHGLSE